MSVQSLSTVRSAAVRSSAESGDGHHDRVRVRRVGQQEQQPSADGFVSLRGRRPLVAAEVVHDDDVSGRVRARAQARRKSSRRSDLVGRPHAVELGAARPPLGMGSHRPRSSSGRPSSGSRGHADPEARGSLSTRRCLGRVDDAFAQVLTVGSAMPRSSSEHVM